MENRTYYYARVSTKEQNLDRQLNAFRQLGATDRDIVTDKESGKNLDRSGYQALKTTVKSCLFANNWKQVFHLDIFVDDSARHIK